MRSHGEVNKYWVLDVVSGPVFYWLAIACKRVVYGVILDGDNHHFMSVC